MLDIIFQTTKSFDGTNILLSCFAGNLTIFAFGFPYIYRAISNLSKISIILTNRIKNNGWVRFYPGFLIISFVLNATYLIWHDNTILSTLSVIFLLIHIIYIMILYQIIENSTLHPFNNVENKDIHKLDIKLKNEKELENDILLVTDLICYLEKSSFNEPNLQKYFSWLIDVTFLKFREYDITKYDYLLGVLPKERSLLYSTLYKIYWLNRWAVNEKKLVSLDYIDDFYFWILEYGLTHPKGFNDKAFPILQTIKNIEDLQKDYTIVSGNKEKDEINKQCDFIKRIQCDVLEQKKQVLLYRINNKFLSNDEISYFVDLLYYILSRKIESKQSEKYEPCFSIIEDMIDNNIYDKYYPQIIEKIKNHHNYFYGEQDNYWDICGFHINIMAYLIYRSQYQLLKDYLYYEEPPERTNQHTRPQIPITINNILFNFIGNNSIFSNTRTFSSNISSYKYKFYTLFVMMLNSKKFADKCQDELSKIKKSNWQYEFIENDFKRHNGCNINFDNISFDNLMSFLHIEKYKEYLDKFCLETELLNILECQNDDLIFIEQILDDTIQKLKKSQSKLLRRQFKNIVKNEFSQYMQDNLKVKNLDEFINIKIYFVYESVKKINFACTDNTNLSNFYLDLYDKVYNKRQILAGQYQYLFNDEPKKDFYRRLFNLLIENCQQIHSIDSIPVDTISNYQILSNFRQRQTFISFGFKRDNIKVKKCIVNGKEESNSDFADVNLIKINDTDIMISEHNNNFSSLNNNGTYPYTIIIFDPKKISIEVGEEQSIKYNNIKGGNVRILNDTQINIKLPKDKSLGYYISLPNSED